MLELALINAHLNPWISCVALGDLFGCWVLFLLGFRKMAFTIYLSSSVLEGVMLLGGILPVQRLIWVTNLIPAVVLAGIFAKAALRNLVLEED